MNCPLATKVLFLARHEGQTHHLEPETDRIDGYTPESIILLVSADRPVLR